MNCSELLLVVCITYLWLLYLAIVLYNYSVCHVLYQLSSCYHIVQVIRQYHTPGLQ